MFQKGTRRLDFVGTGGVPQCLTAFAVVPAQRSAEDQSTDVFPALPDSGPSVLAARIQCRAEGAVFGGTRACDNLCQARVRTDDRRECLRPVLRLKMS